MNKLVTLLLVLSSMSVFANMSDEEIQTRGKSFRAYSMNKLGQEVGQYLSGSCSKDEIYYQCTFVYDLPEDYCWYGQFEANVTYKLNNHAGLDIDEARVDWVD